MRMSDTSGQPGVHASTRRKQQMAAPRAARALIVVVGALIGTLLVWASQTELQEIARAEGEITPTGARLAAPAS